MRLSVFIAAQPSQQLIIDLQKIYAGLLPSDSFTELAITEYIAEPSQRLFMTMFNERHIGAVKVSSKNNIATLSALCIREITRRRGIGKNLLTQIEKQFSSENITHIEYHLSEVNADAMAAMKLFLSASGYQFQGDLAFKSL